MTRHSAEWARSVGAETSGVPSRGLAAAIWAARETEGNVITVPANDPALPDLEVR